MKRNAKPTSHFVIPDCQVRDDVPLEHLAWAGRYAAEKQPDVIVCLGDFADMPSLSSYDKGKKAYEGRRYRKDIDAARRGMELLLTPTQKLRSYKPRLVLTLGNHEDRINRAVEDDPKLEGHVQIEDLGYKEAGWEVHPFLKPVKIHGLNYAHYFTNGGPKQAACTSAAQVLRKKHDSCIAGHRPGFDIATAHRADGNQIICLLTGSFYQHDETYRGPQDNHYWRGCIMLHEVGEGQAQPMFVSLSFLKRKFGGRTR